MVRFVNQAIELAEQRQAKRVKRVFVSVGEMTDVVPEYLHRYYPLAVQNTPLEGSALETRLEPVEVQCGCCECKYHPEKSNGYACPDCHSTQGEITAGRGVVLEQVELVFEDGE